MTELHEQRPLSRIELVVLGRLSGARGATEAELAEALRELGMPLADSALAECVTAALASLGSLALVAPPPEPRQRSAANRKSKKAPSLPKPRKPSRAPFTLTESGRLALGQAFGLGVAPTWKDLCSRIVPALALGELPGSSAATASLRSAEAMIASLLRRDPALGEFATVAELCDRIIARALGMPSGPVTLAGIRAYALAMHCGVASKGELEAITSQFAPTSDPRAAKGTKAPKGARGVKGAKRLSPETELKALAARLADQQLGIESKAAVSARTPTPAAAKAAMVRSLQRRWVSQRDESDVAQRPSMLRAAPLHPPRAVGEPPASSPSPLAVASEAAETLLIAVREAIPMVGSDGRYGKDNVFVSALWQQVRDQRLPELSLDGFKRWLVTANRNQQLALARADMVDDMDARLVEASEIEDLGATFHFVLDRRESPSAPWQVHHGR
jgi:hypothetical protein